MKYLEYTYNNIETGTQLKLGAVEATPNNLIALMSEMPVGLEMRIKQVNGPEQGERLGV